MKAQQPINKYPTADWGYGGWWRCARVEFVGETAEWELSRTGYDFLNAYQKKPHRQLIEARDDNSLRAFVKAWGPLRPYLFGLRSGSDPISIYRRERDRLSAFVRLLGSAASPDDQHSALLGFIKFTASDPETQARLLGFQSHLLSELPPIPDGKTLLNLGEGITDWLDKFTKKQLEKATTWLISTSVLTGSPFQFAVDSHGRGNALRASLGISNLADALDWMVWQDVFEHRPIRFCIECQRLIEYSTQHAKKFCSQKCAHRRSAREWQQQKRKQKRESNGAQETR